MDNIEIVSLTPNDWQLYRDLRLRALKEEPQAFGSTYEENAKHSDKFWKDRLIDTLTKDTQWLVFAKSSETLVGMVGAFVKDDPTVAHLIAMYVIPEFREAGVGKILMHALIEKVKLNQQIKKITLHVNEKQEVAFNLYKNFGFTIVEKHRIALGDGKEHDVIELQFLLDK